MQGKNAILEMIASGNTAEALNELLAMDMPPKDRAVLVQIKASYAQLQRDSHKGILSYEQQTTEQNRINDRLLKFLEGEDENPATVPLPSWKRKWGRYTATFIVLIGILASVAQFSGYSVSDVFKPKETTEQPAISQPPAPKVSTTGDNSPAVITQDGDVNIHYGDFKPIVDSTIKK